MKTCSKCERLLDLSEFNADRSKIDGKYSSCKVCQKMSSKPIDKHKKAAYDKRYRKYRKLNKAASTLKVSVDSLRELFAKRHGDCYICQKPETAKDTKGRIKALAIDHNHDTGKVRGVLCQRCNLALGAFQDNIETIKRAISYLNSFGSLVEHDRD